VDLGNGPYVVGFLFAIVKLMALAVRPAHEKW
jgi:hypothetical protein